MSYKTKRCLIICCIISLAAFFLIFFVIGENYLEVKRSEYIPTICRDISATIVPWFCCNLNCKCAEAPFGVPKCDSLVSESQSLSPVVCSQNSNLCPKTGSNAYCDDGKDPCCSICKDSCCGSVNHKSCQMTCNRCYNVELYVTYNIGQKQQNSTYKEDFSTSLDDAKVFLAGHMPSSTFWCYYNPSSVSEIILIRNFTLWKWLLIAFPAFSLFVCFMALTNWACIEDNAWRWLVFSIIWIGIIVPLVILLQYRLVPDIGLMIIMVFILLFTAFGTLPIVIKLFIVSGYSRLQTISLSFMGLIIPLVVYVPIILYVPSSRNILFAILSIQLTLVLLKIFYIRVKVLLTVVYTFYIRTKALISKHIMLL